MTCMLDLEHKKEKRIYNARERKTGDLNHVGVLSMRIKDF